VANSSSQSVILQQLTPETTEHKQTAFNYTLNTNNSIHIMSSNNTKKLLSTKQLL